MHALLLLPDFGTLPVVSYARVLRHLLELRSAVQFHQVPEPTLIVGVTTGRDLPARMSAWKSLLDGVARKAGERPLRARVVACGTGLLLAATTDRMPGHQADEVLSLVARHPLLDGRQLATLLDISPRALANSCGN